jgi:HAE1 family hydrophobic/amphiphilic exporter-1
MKLADVSIAKPVFATMMVAAILVFGINALPKIGIDLFPDIEFPVVTVLTIYPGADPTAVEEKVSRKIEDAVNTLPGIKSLSSISNENVSQVVIEFEMDASLDSSLQDVRDKVSLIRRDLPTDIEDPVIQKFDFGALPILSYAVSGPPDMSNPALTKFVEDVIRDNIQKVKGVGRVELVGDRAREVHVLVDPTALAAKGLAIDDLAGALMAQNIELPGGRFERGTREFSLRLDNQIRDPREIGAIEIARIEGAPLFVRDVARVVDTEKDARSYGAVAGRPSILVKVIKQSGTNVVAVAEQAKKTIEELAPTFPKGIEVQMVSDNSIWIREAIDDSRMDLIYGAILAVLIILFFLRNTQMTIISAIAIPTSIIGALTVFQALDFTFNYMTMLALSLVVGIVIDDAIVVIENIYRHIEEGDSPMVAARKGTAEIGLAVMATTATIVCVFIPVAFMEGIVGRFFYQFGIVVSAAVLISLFVSFTLTPMLSSRFVRHKESHTWVFKTAEKHLATVERVYGRVISWALTHRGIVVGLALVLLVASCGAASLVPSEFIPQQDEGKFIVRVETPAGSTLEHTRKICARVEQELATVPGIELVSTSIGGGVDEKVNLGELFVRLTDADERPLDQMAMMARFRKRMEGFPGALVTASRATEMSGFRDEPIQFAIRGTDLPAMEKAAAAIVAEMKKTKGFVDIDASFRAGKDEWRLRVDREKASQMGVNPATVALAVRTFVSSAKVGELAQSDDRYDVRVWLDRDARRTSADLDAIHVRAMTGGLVSLADLVTITPAKGPTQIERQARQRQVMIYANLEDLPLGEAQKVVQGLADKNLQAGMSTAFLGDVEAMQDSFKDMTQALILAIVLIYIILASQFESFLHPFTIMFSLPFSVIGAFGGLLISGYSLSLMAMIGIIMLMGLVTKNAILLVDRANQNIARGMPRIDALIDAGSVRLRPILMTTAAMIFGMTPVALALSKGSEIRAPMATCVIGGLITSTALTLVVIPVIYSLMDGLRERLFGRKEAPAAGDEAVA